LGRKRTEEGKRGKGLGMRSGEERKKGERDERKGKKGAKGRSYPFRTKFWLRPCLFNFQKIITS